MSNQDNLNTANELGRTIALLIANPYGQSTDVVSTVNNLVAAMAAKAHDLLNPPALKASTPSVVDVVVGLGDTAQIHGNGDVELVRSGVIDYVGQGATCISHASDCATNNRGVPELLGPCDCMGDLTKALPAGPTLQAYFESNLSMGVIDFSLRTCRLPNGLVGFYVHPAQRSGETAQFIINGNALTTHVAA